MAASTSNGAALQPFFPFEDDEWQDGRNHHQRDRKRITVRPFQLGNVLEIHAVDRGDQGRRHHRHGGDGEYLDDVVLVDVDDADYGVLQELDLTVEISRVVGQ